MGWNNRDVTGGCINVSFVEIPGRGGLIPCRVYTPKKAAGRSGYPCLMYYHGGGFIGGSLKCVDPACKCMAKYGDAVVVSVDYRLAPEHPYPQGFDDCYDALCWVFSHASDFHIDRERMGTCGDSAGANIAAAVAIKDRDCRGGMVKFEALVYPTTNPAQIPSKEYKWNEKEYNIRKDGAYKDLIHKSIHSPCDIGDTMIADLYGAGDAKKMKEVYASPMVESNLKGICPTVIINAEYDFLRLEGEAYGRALAKAGVKTDMIRYQGVDHAFLDKVGDYPQAEDCAKEIAERFRRIVK